MDSKSVRMTALIAAIVASSSAGASITKIEDLESAQVVAELIESGKLKIDAETGKISINSSVLELLKEAGIVKQLKANEVQASGGCNSTAGCCS